MGNLRVLDIAGAIVRDRDIVSQRAANDGGLRLGREANGHVGARALAATIQARRRCQEKRPALQRAHVKQSLVNGPQPPSAVDVRAGFSDKDRQRRFRLERADERSERPANGV
jgi:hypothetical protein